MIRTILPLLFSITALVLAVAQSPGIGTFSRIYFKDGSVTGPHERWGSASPNASVTAPRGSTYRRTSDGTLWVNTDAGTTWSQLSTAAGDIQTLLDGISTTQGAVLYRNASDWVALSPGTSGHFLQTQGASANPQWAASSGSSNWTGVIATADETVTSSTTFQNDDVLLCAVSANKNYAFEFVGHFTTSTDPNIDGKFTFTVPSGATVMGRLHYFAPAATLINGERYVAGVDATGTMTFGVLSTAQTLTTPVMFNGTVFVGGTGGNLQLQWAQANSSGTGLIRKTGSRLSCFQVN